MKLVASGVEASGAGRREAAGAPVMDIAALSTPGTLLYSIDSEHKEILSTAAAQHSLSATTRV